MTDAIKGLLRVRLLSRPSNGHGVAREYSRLAPTGKYETPLRATYLHNSAVFFCGMNQGLTG